MARNLEPTEQAGLAFQGRGIAGPVVMLNWRPAGTMLPLVER